MSHYSKVTIQTLHLCLHTYRKWHWYLRGGSVSCSHPVKFLVHVPIDMPGPDGEGRQCSSCRPCSYTTWAEEVGEPQRRDPHDLPTWGVAPTYTPREMWATTTENLLRQLGAQHPQWQLTVLYSHTWGLCAGFPGHRWVSGPPKYVLIRLRGHLKKALSLHI